METDPPKGRRLKKTVLTLLQSDSLETATAALLQMPPRRVINPLFSLLYHTDAIIKWRAVSAMGSVVSHQATHDLQSARIVMRRLMWNLNDESGGIGWGSPEAMGDIMASCPVLAKEYANMLISYIHPHGNFLEHEGLQQGSLWGFGRLAHARPDLLQDAAKLLIPFMKAKDTPRRGLAVWCAGPLSSPEIKAYLESLSHDMSEITLYLDRKLIQKTISAIAKEALANFVTS